MIRLKNDRPLPLALLAFRKEFLLVGFYSLVINLLLLSPSLYMLQVFDRVISSQNELTLIAISLIALFLFGIMAFTENLRSALLVRTGVRFDSLLGTQIFNASFEANLNQGDTNPMRAFGDLLQIRQFLTGNGIYAFFDAPWAPVFMAVLYLLHPWLGIASCIAALLQAAMAWLGHRRTSRPSEAAHAASIQPNAYLQNKLANAEVIEAMGMVPHLKSRWERLHRNFLEVSATVNQVTHKLTASSKFVRYLQQSLALGLGALLVIDGQLSAGAMIAANLLMARALAPIDMIVSSWRQFTDMRMAFGRLDKLLAENPLAQPLEPRPAPAGAVKLVGVSATVAGRRAPILEDINLAFAPGSVVAILGSSGSGKSTLARVILGLWPQVTGQVLLDGVPLQAWNPADLGPHIGYLPQDVDLFEGSIAENIARFGALDSASIIQAAQCAGLHETILRLPHGYNTPVGTAGGLLSGGQRQRIGLARAVYGDPRLVVLDEPNANLDEAGEASLADTVRQLKAQGITVIVVTHRSGILAVVDRVIVLQAGKIFGSSDNQPQAPSQVDAPVAA